MKLWQMLTFIYRFFFMMLLTSGMTLFQPEHSDIWIFHFGLI